MCIPEAPAGDPVGCGVFSTSKSVDCHLTWILYAFAASLVARIDTVVSTTSFPEKLFIV
jgi:hypothetical protein